MTLKLKPLFGFFDFMWRSTNKKLSDPQKVACENVLMSIGELLPVRYANRYNVFQAKYNLQVYLNSRSQLRAYIKMLKHYLTLSNESIAEKETLQSVKIVEPVDSILPEDVVVVDDDDEEEEEEYYPQEEYQDINYTEPSVDVHVPQAHGTPAEYMAPQNRRHQRALKRLQQSAQFFRRT